MTTETEAMKLGAQQTLDELFSESLIPFRLSARVVEAAPNFVDAYINRAQVRQSQRDFDSAIGDYSKAIELKPDAGVYYARATARQAKQDLNGALTDYSKAISLDPNLAQSYAGRGVIEALQGKKAEAIQDFERAFKIEPSLRPTFKDFIEKRLNVTVP